ncbi:amidohydrolase family protein [candidate division KSB1 bacterium]
MIKSCFPKTHAITLTLILLTLVRNLFAQDIPKISIQDRISNEKKSIKILSDGPDIILHNANVITMDDQLPNAQAIAITSNLITAVGSNGDILSLQAANTQLFDLQGRTVVPGMIEGHSHFLALGLSDDGLEGLARATQDMAANGFTTVHEAGGNPDFIPNALTLAQNKELSVRINIFLSYNKANGENVIPWKTYPYTEKVDTTLRVVGVKIFADGGSSGSPATTTLIQHGRGAGTYGNLFRTQDEMNAIVDSVLKAGYPIAMHAIGDSGIGVGLNAFENAFAGTGNTLRSRMEHLRVMREDLADQMAALGIGASIQYTWANSQSVINLESIYLPEVLEWLYPWRRMADRGIPIIGGNDYPFCSRIHSMQTISLLATRKMWRSDSLPAWMDGDQLTVEEGLRAMTVTNAWNVFEEDLKGTITSGKLADLTILSDDPLTTDPFDVRDITVEMTIMDGIIRHNQMGITHTAVHDAGSFKFGIDDRGLWGPIRSGTGLQYNGLEYLYQGSVLISYDDNTVSTSNFRQQDYVTSSGGSVDIQEPGTTADEEATVVYEDGAAGHNDKFRITQQSFMWDEEPLLLVKYTFENISNNPLSDIYIGQIMDFDIGQYDSGTYMDNMADWESHDGLSFAYMYNAFSSAYPYIGIAMFDSSGNCANSELSFTSRVNFENGRETSMSEIMRSGTIASGTSEASDYSMLLSAGPISFDVNQSKSPFLIAIVAGENLEELKTAVNQAYDHINSQTNIPPTPNGTPDKFVLSQNYPNPFNNATTIAYQLPKAAMVNISIYNIPGQLVETLVNESQAEGFHKVQWNADNVVSGLYFYRIQAGDFIEVKKCLLLK